MFATLKELRLFLREPKPVAKSSREDLDLVEAGRLEDSKCEVRPCDVLGLCLVKSRAWLIIEVKSVDWVEGVVDDMSSDDGFCEGWSAHRDEVEDM